MGKLVIFLRNLLAWILTPARRIMFLWRMKKVVAERKRRRSNHSLKKVYRPILQYIDRRFSQTRDVELLMQRRRFVATRRAGFVPGDL